MTGVTEGVTLLLPTAIVTRSEIRPRAGDYRNFRYRGRRAGKNAMAFIRLPLGVRVAVEFDWNGEVVLNVHHVILDGPITLVNITMVANTIGAWAIDHLLPNMSTTTSLTGVTATSLDVPNGEQYHADISPPEPGAVGGESMPNNVAIVCAFYTAKTGRSYRGRAYVPGMAELYVNGNFLDGAVAASVAAAYAELQADLAIINGTLVVASFETAGAPRAEGIGTPVESFAVNLRVDTQRRRLPN